ncbi:MAG: ABC transporter permease [Bacteroidota bacterium]
MYFLTELREGLAISLGAIRANKMRSLLTMLGIFIGILSVTLMATVIDYLNKSFERSASAFGTETMYVEKFPWVSNEDWSTMRNRRDFKVEYADQLERQLTLVDAVAPVMGTRRIVKFESNQMESALITGTTSAYMKTSGNSDIDGRFFSEEESSGGRPVCAIGATVAENLFPMGDPIGKTIRIDGYPYTVLGVFEKQGGMFGEFTSDNRVYLPLHSFISHFGGRRYVSIHVRAVSKKALEDARLEVEGIMRNIRRIPPGAPSDFSINASDQLTSAFGPISLTIGVIGLFITGLSLFVGGIGIMNIMFVSVTERTREIGIRKAIGAKKRAILLQFLTESIVLCILGSIIGLLVSFVLVIVLSNMMELEAAMPFSVVFIALIVSVGVGVVSGFLPAYRAAKMDPVEALRYE